MSWMNRMVKFNVRIVRNVCMYLSNKSQTHYTQRCESNQTYFCSAVELLASFTLLGMHAHLH